MSDCKGIQQINRKSVIVHRAKYNLYFREYRVKHKEKMRAYCRAYNKKWRKEHGYHNEMNSKKRYPEKEKARQILHYAIRTGKLVKKPCERCGREKSQAHHSDYSKPLLVVWLCSSHHIEIHPRLQEIKTLAH